MRLPQRLLKYAPEPRFLSNGMFRFSQPAVLNDPYEAFPKLLVSDYAPEDIETARQRASRDGHSHFSDEWLIAFYLQPFPSRRFDEKSFPGLWPAREMRLREHPFDTLAEFDEAIAQRVVDLGLERANRTAGILSLSESAHETMWAHYAQDHHGVCIDFDPTHPFFQTNAFGPIGYTDQPIHVSVNDGWVRFGGRTVEKETILNRQLDFLPNEIFWRKQAPWAYEAEWRMLKALSDADETIPAKGDGELPICLFSVPPEAVVGLTFGWRADHGNVAKTLGLIEDDVRWRHLFARCRLRSSKGLTEETIRVGASG